MPGFFSSSNDPSYRTGNEIELSSAVELYIASTLGERRPVDQPERIAAMLRNSNLVVSAWDKGLLVGISRALSDFSYVTYLADLAVRVSHQRSGIGRELIRRTREIGGSQTRIVLLSAPKASDYYEHIGFARHPSAWVLESGASIR